MKPDINPKKKGCILLSPEFIFNMGDHIFLLLSKFVPLYVIPPMPKISYHYVYCGICEDFEEIDIEYIQDAPKYDCTITVDAKTSVTFIKAK